MIRLLTFLKTHGPTIFFGAVFLLATCVLRPTLDKYEQERVAKEGATMYASRQ
jgi:hypothetical protein